MRWSTQSAKSRSATDLSSANPCTTPTPIPLRVSKTAAILCLTLDMEKPFLFFDSLCPPTPAISYVLNEVIFQKKPILRESFDHIGTLWAKASTAAGLAGHPD